MLTVTFHLGLGTLKILVGRFLGLSNTTESKAMVNGSSLCDSTGRLEKTKKLS